MLRAFAFVHLNLAFSSIEESQRATVIERCYWPLLRLARRLRLPIGIEASGYTLEAVEAIDPAWLAELRDLVTSRQCELIGCGYTQLIGPLAPAVVNEANLRLGHSTYERLLGIRPTLALVNEQAYSAGLGPLYADAGYKAIIMEWNNPASAHPDWQREWRYFPQRAAAPDGSSIPVIWNESIAFQKFQRYAHGDMELEEYLDYLRSHAGPDRAFPVYGNDVEVFDFRPGRFMTEAPIHGGGEWRRIEELFEAVLREPGVQFVRPSEVLDTLGHKNAGHTLSLESASQPIPVKKQGKYNILRWAVTGRDDLALNTECYRRALKLTGSASTEDEWRELCYLWSSDFRTHITPTRWSAYRGRLSGPDGKRSPGGGKPAVRPTTSVTESKNRILVSVPGLEAALSRRRGLAIESLTFRNVDSSPLCGTVPHGTYDDIRYSPDWYTGNLVFEAPAQHKVTDLEAVADATWGEAPDGSVIVSGTVQTPLGPVRKRLRFVTSGDAPFLELRFEAEWPTRGIGSLRLGFVTLLPGKFDEASLYYRTHNGGRAAETFSLAGMDVNHGASVSALVSASQALGVTEGRLELGDAGKAIVVEVDKAESALVGMVEHRRVGDKIFCQLLFSAEEIDDTRRPQPRESPALVASFRISARRNEPAR